MFIPLGAIIAHHKNRNYCILKRTEEPVRICEILEKLHTQSCLQFTWESLMSVCEREEKVVLSSLSILN